MKGRSVWLVLTASVLVAVGCSKPPRSSPSPIAGVHLGAVAPNFTLPNGEGGSISLSQFRGRKPVLLFFSMGPG